MAWFSIHPPRYGSTIASKYRHLPIEEITLTTSDGCRLACWSIEAKPARATIILVHGMASCRGQMLRWAPWLHAAGYSLVIPDLRGQGRSSGRGSLGRDEWRDVEAAVQFAALRDGDVKNKLVILGYSMGGYVTAVAASRGMGADAIIIHGGYSELDSTISYRCRHHFGPLAKLVERVCRTVGPFFCDVSIDQIDLKHYSNGPLGIPALITHGALDPIIPLRQLERLASLLGPNVTTMVFPTCAHHYPLGEEETAYCGAVLRFLEESLAA